ncbi:MAG: hypothetical protein A3I26_03515 [Candidatus Yanofskybacteria bacterium RIFCSPLOWO2_02_FULL_43_10]|uniref:LemA family protein n=1 Tax=Candidatus Yanofskybacteria bacterium RIFCSPLOWO2_12_FULL_43_11b TaxID=1802710 RepID=A0A1F8H978_9BACT|nr:MAG: hypothetical protein A2742_00735 [Candidatus Yanofskybacteria bacterium RIFCSPHIGHO2_01_FULL_43_32]OGN11289.1 MAG: hypothetical protein A3C69_00870 [Candidatus Yanofskybacteria bacterium RIFCSPHIGHO2_02_FULL_43_12]OGN24211.1 MAG: hypothetical protein A2923_02675 [Candidatus Yanofskybacteria bacterium RIFCSPLOWO2_01_FULL_43_46]OGN30665.1 MAG: hypothetical protein A3I26_03515 [Candidatus Yanofskybacteria bacterium RIFCSPLOWO2_02_FULL_43_10]OGN34172.1 MAG: hypothetical protein A3G51_03055 
MNGRRSKRGSVPVLLIITVVVLGGLFAGGVSLYGYANGVRNNLVSQETALNAQYQDNQNELGNYEVAFYEQTGLANLKSEKMDKIISDAVKGRYEGKDGQPVERGQGGAFFSAMVEAYPDLRGQLDVYDKIISFVASGREAYKAKQSKQLDMLRAYESYRQTGWVRSLFVNWIGYPSLRAQIGQKVVRGTDALSQMELIVTTETTNQSYESGKMKALTVPE